jgi:hypothetical protein
LITSQLRVLLFSAFALLSLRFQQSLKFYTEIFASVKNLRFFFSAAFGNSAPRAFELLCSAEPTIMARVFGLPNRDSIFLQNTRDG